MQAVADMMAVNLSWLGHYRQANTTKLLKNAQTALKEKA